MFEPAVAILPYEMRLRSGYERIACSQLIWPLGCPDRLQGGGVLADMVATDHLLVYPRSEYHLWPYWKLKAQVSLMVQEPRAIHQKHRSWLWLSHRKFFRVLSHDKALVGAVPNGVFVPFGTTWVSDWRDRDLSKSQSCSLIASSKRSQIGHRLRHEIVDWARAEGLDMTAMGGGYAPFAVNAEGLARFRYSVVIENVREPDYFSEKLIDSLLCLTVPIYWGCPNISEYLPTEALILCENADQVKAAVWAVSAEDYQQRRANLQQARQAALKYVDLERRSAEALIASI